MGIGTFILIIKQKNLLIEQFRDYFHHLIVIKLPVILISICSSIPMLKLSIRKI